LSRASAGVDKKWVLEIKIAPILCEKIQVLNCRKILARASAGVDKKWVLEIKIAPVLCEKNTSLELENIFLQGLLQG
jgi:hypothetical protein